MLSLPAAGRSRACARPVPGSAGSSRVLVVTVPLSPG